MHEFLSTYQQYSSSKKRREELNSLMKSYSEKGFNCNKCIGNCCTFTSNTMMISPLEAFDIIVFLSKNDDFKTDALKSKLEKNIREFRLDYNSSIRKTYTCPFYTGKNKGCSISEHSKPYGCLAFVPNEVGVTKGSSCSSKQAILKNRHGAFNDEESHLNLILTKELNLLWDKLPISLAVIELIKKGEHLLS